MHLTNIPILVPRSPPGGNRGVGNRESVLGRWQEVESDVSWGSNPFGLHLKNTNSKTKLLRLFRWQVQSIKLQVWGPSEFRALCHTHMKSDLAILLISSLLSGLCSNVSLSERSPLTILYKVVIHPHTFQALVSPSLPLNLSQQTLSLPDTYLFMKFIVCRLSLSSAVI